MENKDPHTQIELCESLINEHNVLIDFIEEQKSQIIDNYVTDKNREENENIERKILLQKLKDHILNSPIVLAAITESVHRYYYDNVLNNRKVIDENISSIHTSLHNLNPDWRSTLYRTAERYSNTGKINKCLVISKPKKHHEPEIKINFKTSN